MTCLAHFFSFVFGLYDNCHNSSILPSEGKQENCSLPLPLPPFFYRIQEILLYCVDPLVAIQLYQLILPIIIVKQLNGLVEKDIESPLYSFSYIIRALFQFASIEVTYTRRLWWTSVYVINVLVGTTDIPSREPLEQFLTWNLQ